MNSLTLTMGCFICLSFRTSPLWLVSQKSTSRHEKFTSLSRPRRPCSLESTAPRSGRWTLTPESAGKTHWWAGPQRKSLSPEPDMICRRETETFPVKSSNSSDVIFLNVVRALTSLCLSYFSGDPLSNMMLTFSSKEDAIAFAEKNGEIISKYSQISPKIKARLKFFCTISSVWDICF